MKMYRRSIMLGTLVASSLIAAAGLSPAASPAAASEPTLQLNVTSATTTEPVFVDVTGGTVMGASVDGVNQFKGIPYASAERFQAPLPASWPGVQKALSFGEVCPNGADSVNSYEFAGPSGQDLVENENCLNLNVWTNSLGDAAKKPVVVWIHGGGLTSGSSGELAFYDGYNFAKNKDVVFISLNSRLNALGYLDLSAYGPQYAGTGNLGQLDQVAALEWVQANASLFGGDAENVTIIGQSGGAAKVSGLMAMPSAQGLFDKAVAMSGSSTISTTTQEEARAKSADILQRLGVATVDELKQVPYDNLLEAATAANFSASLVVDGDVLPEAPIKDGVFSELSKDIPLLVTNNLGEFTSNVINATGFTQAEDPLRDVYKPDLTPERVEELLTERFGPWKDLIVEEFRTQFPNHDVADVLFMSTLPFVDRATTANPKSATPGGAPVYSALFAWQLPFFGGTVSYHTSGDLPFIFNNTDKIPELVAGDEKGASEFSQVTSDALRDFVYTGNPGGNGASAWPAYTSDAQWSMVFDSKSELKNAPDRKLIQMITSATSGEPVPSPEQPGTGVPPAPVGPDVLDESNRGPVTVAETAAPGQAIQVGLGEGSAGKEFWISATPGTPALIQVVADAAGNATFVIPNETTLGQVKIVVQNADGSLYGWAPIEIVSAAAGGTGGNSSDDGLALTGADALRVFAAALALVLAGGFALKVARNRRERVLSEH